MQDKELEAELLRKEQEWKELKAKHTQQLESALKEAQAQLALERSRFLQLRDDFLFNLNVLEERDRELEEHASAVARLRVAQSSGQAEASELRIQIERLREEVAARARQVEELDRRNQHQLAQHKQHLARVQKVKDGDIERHREEYETLKRELERQIQEVKGELELQKQELTAEFENELKRREHEFTLKTDEMSNIVLAHELKVKLLSRELEALGHTHSQAAEALKDGEQRCRQMQRQLRQREIDFADLSAVKDARMKELIDKLCAMEANQKKQEELHNRKHEHLDRCAREREAALVALKEAHAEQLRKAEAQSRELQAVVDTLMVDKRKTEWAHAEVLKEKEEQMERLHSELESMRADRDAYIQQVSKDTVSKDMELHTLCERETKLRAELQKCRTDVEGYKRQLASAVQREQALEQARVQAHLDWERRCEDAKAAQYLKDEELIQGLTEARDQVTAELREKERQLQEMSTLLRSVTTERDQAAQGARGTDRQGAQTAFSSFQSDEIQRLQQQNQNLRSAITEMRREMEKLSQEMPKATTAHAAGSADGDLESCQLLEQEKTELKARCRRLEEQLEEALSKPGATPVPTSTLPAPAENVYLQNHIRSLNETIGVLRAEKVQSAALLRKQEVRVAHLESALSQLTGQFHSKQAESEELRLELANQKKRSASEEAGLRQRLAAMEMELEEARREAEEYHKGSMLQNMEAVALGNQVSALKLDIASQREPIVIEETAALQQLREENLTLRQQLLGQVTRDGDSGILRVKLKKAVRYIAQLSHDKQQLIDIGNRLRAQLTEAGLGDHSGQHDPPSSAPKGSSLAMQEQSRMSALEQLQYKLTTQDLEYAQRAQSRHNPVVEQPHISERESRNKVAGLHMQREKENTVPHWDQPAALSDAELDVGRSSGQSQPLMSSLGTDGSLQEIWQMLDAESSGSVSTPSQRAHRVLPQSDKGSTALKYQPIPNPGSHIGVHSSRLANQVRRKPEKVTAVPERRAKKAGRGGSVRNYNIKD